MAASVSELSALRAATFRISSTPTAQLPQQIAAVSSSLCNCKTILSSAQASTTKSASESSVAVHKFRTQLSTLLQDRTVQGRWAAIVLIKSTIEIGGWETLQKSLPWVRGLLGILTKPDPPSSKKLCIITLVRIFVLTRDYPTLVREITTPSLPTFIQSCLNLASSKGSSSLLGTILESFGHLLPRHPTIFRSYLKQLHQLLAFTIAPTPSNRLSREQQQGFPFDIPSDVAEAARRLYVQLPCCAAKGGSTEEWERVYQTSISSAHQVADKIFRAVIEDWQPSVPGHITSSRQALTDVPQELEPDSLGLPGWSGIYAGGERLEAILRLIKQYVASPTAAGINLRLNGITDLLRRLFSLTVPAGSGFKDVNNSHNYNNQVSREERENLWAILPSIHVAAIELLLALTHRFGTAFSSLASVILDQLVWVFNAEKNSNRVRAALYIAIGQLLKLSGIALPKTSIDPLGPVIRACCNDLHPQDPATPAKGTQSQTKTNGTNHQQSSTNADSFLNLSKQPISPTADFKGLTEAAHTLLPILLTNLPAQHLSDSLRTRMDRTAILIQHKDAMVASVLNPPPSKKFGKAAASILPLLARSCPAATEVETFLRPRMPVIRIGRRSSEEDEDEEEEENGDEEEMDEEEEDGHFVGEQLEALLDSETNVPKSNEDEVMGNTASDAAIGTHTTTATSEDAAAPSVTPTASTERDQSVGSAKRHQTEETPASPSKRLRVDESRTQTVESVVTAPRIVQTASLQTNKPSQLPILPVATSQPTATSAAGPSTAMNDSDDDDDFGTLVLGQDTDDEE